ncbi:MAG: hypothetical protein V3U23_10280 [Kiloniellales bacterium]
MGMIDPVNPVYIYKVEQIGRVEGPDRADFQMPDMEAAFGGDRVERSKLRIKRL